MIDHKPDHYWYFAAKNCQLRYDDRRIAEVGVTHEVSGTPKLCRHGLHDYNRCGDLPADAREIGSRCAEAIRARASKW